MKAIKRMKLYFNVFMHSNKHGVSDASHSTNCLIEVWWGACQPSVASLATTLHPQCIEGGTWRDSQIKSVFAETSIQITTNCKRHLGAAIESS